MPQKLIKEAAQELDNGNLELAAKLIDQVLDFEGTNK